MFTKNDYDVIDICLLDIIENSSNTVKMIFIPKKYITLSKLMIIFEDFSAKNVQLTIIGKLEVIANPKDVANYIIFKRIELDEPAYYNSSICIEYSEHLSQLLTKLKKLFPELDI